MTFLNKSVLRFASPVCSVSLAQLALALVVSGCGNYSNEDLEFMSALPSREEVAVVIPRNASLTTARSAKGWRETLEVTQGMNAVADGFLSLIDKMRASYPSSRDANTRIWGPFPAENNPGWQIEFRMWKTIAEATNPARFDYELLMIPPVGSPSMGAGPIRIIGGRFDAGGGVRIGVGELIVTLDQARTAGLVLANLEQLRTLTISYNTQAWPRTMTMTILNLPPIPPATDAASATYEYARSENGDGATKFSFVSDLVNGVPGVSETLRVNSRWLGSGEGRQDIMVLQGDGIGASTIECWDSQFVSTYTSRNWVIPPMTTGNEASCIPSA